MLIGMLIGVFSIPLPSFIGSAVSSLAACGKDISVAAGMALISHLISLIIIPILFMLFQYLIK